MSPTIIKLKEDKRSTKNRVFSSGLIDLMKEESQDTYYRYELEDFLVLLKKVIWQELSEGRGVTIEGLVSFAARENLPHQWRNPKTGNIQMTSYNLSAKAKTSPILLRYLKTIPMKEQPHD